MTQTAHDVIGQTRGQRVSRALGAVLWLVIPFLYVRLVNSRSAVFSAQLKASLIAAAVLFALVVLVFAYHLFVEGPFQVAKAEWERAEAAAATNANVEGPITDRVSVLAAALYMTFQDWSHTADDLTPEDNIRVLGSCFRRMEQDVIDERLDIWVQRTRYGKHVLQSKEYWEDHHINWVAEHGALSVWPDQGGHLTQTFDPLVRKSDIERLYG